MRPALALSVGLALLLCPVARSQSSDALLSAPAWGQTLNGGTVTFADGVICLHGIDKGFPVLQTRSDPFPASGDWTAALGYRYSRTGNYGTDIRCERADGSGAAVIHQDVNGQFLALDGRSVWNAPAGAGWHVVTLSHLGDRLRASVDGKPVGDTAAGAALARIRLGGGLMDKPWDWNDLEVAMMRVRPGPPDSPAPPATATAPPDAPHPVAVGEQERAVDCLAGDTLRLTGSYSNESGLRTRLLMLGDRPVQTTALQRADDEYALSWRADGAGQTWLLGLSYALNDGRTVHARRLTVNVLPAAPLALDGLPVSPVADADITFRATGAAFRPARVEVRFNGQTLSTDAAHSFRATLPLGGLPAGDYPLSYDAWDEGGGHYASGTQTVRVPERVRAVAADAMTLDDRATRPHAEARTAPGVAPEFVVYQIEGRTVAASAQAPFGAGLSLSDLKSGAYDLRAVAVDAGGHSLVSPVARVTLTNRPDDAAQAEAERLVREARAKADAREAAKAAGREADARVGREQRANIDAGFVPRPGMDVAVFRQQVSARGHHDPDAPGGRVGAVHGLAVLTVGGRAANGVLFGVDAIVRPGTGQTNFLAFSEEDARVAAQQAAECCKRMTAQMGYRWDWSKYDLTVGYRENEVKSAGPSAGAADAAAIMSAVFNKPVDASVAMTGAISLQGEVLPVGGVDFKAEAALSDPSIRTLLVPAGTDSMGDIAGLFTLEPGLFVGKQVILVRTLDDVLRYALIGWDQTGNVLRSQKVLQRGIELFGQGKDQAALDSFTLAQRLAPENLAPGYWSGMVRAVQKIQKGP